MVHDTKQIRGTWCHTNPTGHCTCLHKILPELRKLRSHICAPLVPLFHVPTSPFRIRCCFRSCCSLHPLLSCPLRNRCSLHLEYIAVYPLKACMTWGVTGNTKSFYIDTDMTNGCPTVLCEIHTKQRGLRSGKANCVTPTPS
jgi:hypothetical protein